MIVLIQLFEEDGFTDEFESKVIENIVKRSSSVKWAREDADNQYYILQKKNVGSLMEELQAEEVRQKEKSLFKKRSTRTLKELHIIINILEILKGDQVVAENKDIVMFVIKVPQKLLDI